MNPGARPVPSSPRLAQRIADLRAELLGFLRRRTGDPEEVAQETWLRVAQADPDCPDERSFRAFVYVVARRLLIDLARRRARGAVLVPLDGGLVGGHGPESELLAGQALAVVEETLAGLKPELAEVFRLRMTTDLSFAEIARRQGVPVNTALGRHHQATNHVARALRAHGLLPE
jgi:RNA polymerase sigma factor (sigma-70 family)